jgi:hypothetical protein
LAVAKGVTAFEPAAAGRFLALPTGTGRMMDVDQAAKAMKDAEIEAEIEIRTKEDKPPRPVRMALC